MYLSIFSLLLSTPALASSTAGTPVDIYAYLSDSESMVMELTVDGDLQCRIDATHNLEHFERPICTLTVPAGEVKIVAKGKITGEHWKTGKTRTVSVDREWVVRDASVATAPLAQRSSNYGKQVAAFIEKIDAFASASIPADDWYGADLEAGTPAKRSEIQAAEKRLGFALPAKYAELVTTVGALSIQDSSFTAPEELRDTYEAMLRDWGTPEDILSAELEPRTAELFRATTVLFTEVGDGLGGLLYRPRELECNDGPAYYWVHQDEINNPEILRDSAGHCADFAEAFYFLIDSYVMEQVLDSMPEKYVLIDSTTGKQALILTPRPWNEPGTELELEMRPRGPYSNRMFDKTHTPSF